MATRDFVVRELEPGTCIRIGTTLKANIKELTDSGETFPAKLQSAISASSSATNELDSFVKSVPMILVDRGTDRAIGGYRALIEGITNTLHPTTILLLSKGAEERLANAARLLELLFPNGTGYLKLTFDEQWESLRELQKTIQSKEAQELIESLGLQEESAQALQWIELYGKRRGITESQKDSVAKLEDLLARWHNAYEKLALQAKAHYDEDNPAENQKLQRFLAPYATELEKMRQEDRERAKKYREAKKS